MNGVAMPQHEATTVVVAVCVEGGLFHLAIAAVVQRTLTLNPTDGAPLVVQVDGVRVLVA